MCISPISSQDTRGYVECGMQWIGRKIFHLNGVSKEEQLRLFLLDGMKNKTICPTVLFKQFEHLLTEEQQKEIFERLGKKAPLQMYDRLMNRIWRNAEIISRRFIEMGKFAARKDPYLLAQDFTAALQKTDPATCICQ